MRGLTQGEFLSPRPVGRAWGQQLIVTGEKPAAGKDWVFKMPSTYLTRLVSLRTVLANSVTVGGRLIGVQISDADGKLFYEQKATNLIAAEVTAVVSVTTGEPAVTGQANASQVFLIPEVLFPPEYIIRGTSEGLQAGDQYAAPVLLVEQFEPMQDRPLAQLAAEVSDILKLREAAAYAAG